MHKHPGPDPFHRPVPHGSASPGPGPAPPQSGAHGPSKPEPGFALSTLCLGTQGVVCRAHWQHRRIQGVLWVSHALYRSHPAYPGCWQQPDLGRAPGFKCPQYIDPEIHSEKSRPFWPSQNVSLRKIIFGIDKGNTLPIPVLRNSEDDKVRSFFVQRCILYHNALHEKSPELKMNQKGVVGIARAPRPRAR